MDYHTDADCIKVIYSKIMVALIETFEYNCATVSCAKKPEIIIGSVFGSIVGITTFSVRMTTQLNHAR